MDMSEVKAFNTELSGLYDNKPPISKAKMSAITRGAIKAIKFYKHVVHSVEKFIQKCKPEYKVPGLYVIDSIVRQSRHQFGQDKDVFAPRFAKNMQQTFANLFRCPPEDKRNIIRVLNLWQKNNVFSSQVIQPLLDMADPNHPLHAEVLAQQNNTANGSSQNASHSSDKGSPAAAPLHSPPDSSPMGDQFQDQPSSQSGVKFNRKLLNDFEYESEDEPMPVETTPAHHNQPHQGHQGHQGHQQHQSHSHQQHQTHQPITSQNPADVLGSILTNPEIMRQLQNLQLMTGMQISNLMPMMNDMQMQHNQNQNLPFLNSQPEQQKQSENKDDVANESDIEFVETGPQVIEIPDANDSRSPSPRSRRARSRSRSAQRRRRDRDRRRNRDRDREKDREKSYKEREAEKEKQREREKKGLPPIKKENLSVCSTTLWVGHLSKLATQEELSDLFGAIGGVISIDVVAPRGCAFVVMERRRDANKAKNKLNKHKLHSKEITVAWAPGKGVKGREWKDYWEAELGVSYLPWAALQQRWQLGALSLDALEDGGAVDEDTLPPWLPPRIIPKMMDNLSMLGLPPSSAANMLGLAGAPLPPPLMPPNMPPPALPQPLSMTVPRMSGLPPGMAPGLPPGLRPNLTPGVPGLSGEAGLPPGGLLRFPGALPPQTMPQPGLVGGFLGGLLGVGGLVPALPLLPPQAQPHKLPPAQQRPETVNQADDAMDLDTEDQNESPSVPAPDTSTAPPLLPDQLQAMLSKPPPAFNASEPPPGFNLSEPPPFNSAQPPPTEENKVEDERKSDRDRRDRDRDRDRERRGDRDRRDRDRRGDRDRDRGRERDRDSRDSRHERHTRRSRGREHRERSREKSPRPNENPEKSLQDRLWEMANGKPRESDKEFDIERPTDRERERPPLIDRLPTTQHNEQAGWTPVPRPAAPHLAPPFRAGGPWMDGPGPGPGPGFGPRFNGMGPPPFNRPPFERPPFEGPMFDGPPRFERPPFNRMPFDGMNRPPFDGPRPPFDGPRPPFDGPRPPFDGPRPPFDGPRQFDGPPFDGDRPFDGPRFDGPPEFFDRGRRYDDREQFNDRGWNGDRENREWPERRGDWDDRRRDRRSRDHEDRFRDRPERPERLDRADRAGDRRRSFESRQDDKTNRHDDKTNKQDDKSNKHDDKANKHEDEKQTRPPREERNRNKDRKSRWGAAEETTDENRATESTEIPMEVENKNVEAEASHEEQNVQNYVNDNNKDNETTETIESQSDNAFAEANVDKFDNVTSVQDNYDSVPNEQESTISRDEDNSYEKRDREVENETPRNQGTHNQTYDNDESNKHYPETENVTLESDPIENSAPKDFVPDLYDASEVIDTSFQPSINSSEPPIVEKSSIATDNNDIFSQDKEETNKNTEEIVESKEGAA
ncbi:SR-related and CTD-associated factor 4 isoform X3 [Plodia interpunctella]|uniref:SR-related and CTD-associated factor 4 isoform X3 n=1 Tax=Plodia interpunctella TaxID=58824 RepID=UPI002367765C|nr:SR-related and CTD-associated factor 4 isoform X3 [Plodia interpunctella]